MADEKDASSGTETPLESGEPKWQDHDGWRGWIVVAASACSLVIYMGVTGLATISTQLQAAGLSGETPAAPVFVDGQKFRTLRGPSIATDFKALVIDYIEQRYGAGAKTPAVTAAE